MVGWGDLVGGGGAWVQKINIFGVLRFLRIFLGGRHQTGFFSVVISTVNCFRVFLRLRYRNGIFLGACLFQVFWGVPDMLNSFVW